MKAKSDTKRGYKIKGKIEKKKDGKFGKSMTIGKRRDMPTE